MTEPPADTFLFEIPAPPTPVERLLLLAGQYTLHNDTLDLGLAASTDPDPATHVASARRLASETSTAISAVIDQQPHINPDLSDALVRLSQLAYLSAQSGHDPRMARDLTALAPEAIVNSAARIAQELGRGRSGASTAQKEHLTPLRCLALYEIARGHVVVTESVDRQYVHSRGIRVPISTVRHLESHGLINRAGGSAAPAFKGGPPQDRVRLTPAGVTAVASFIGLPPASTSTPTGVVPPSPVQPASRSR